MKGNKSYQANNTMDLKGNAAACESRCSRIRGKQVSRVSIIAVYS